MLIRPQRCASGFVLEAHWKSFHSSVQIQWARYVSQVHIVWISCFSSLPANAVRARWRALTVRQPNRVWNGSQRFSSPSNMQCVLSSPYLISSHLQWQRCVCARARICMCVCGCILVWEGATLCILFLSHFILHLAGNWQSCPRHSNYFIEQRCFLWHDASQKIPPNYTCHAAWSCPSWQHGPTKWFTRFLSWMDATPLISQHYEGRGGRGSRPPKQSILIWYPSIHPVNLNLQL